MDPAFWRQRWQDNKIGFHLEEVNPYLIEHWPRMGIEPPATVFVPLCGKTVDIRWLLEQGYRVEGIELSELAIEQFFSEQGLSYEVNENQGLRAYCSENLRIWCGDFFDLEKHQLGRIDVIYDRAALIALPVEMRGRYVHKLIELAGPAPQFLITLSYDQAQMAGPPFAVEYAEVNALYREVYGDIAGPDVEIGVLPSHAHFAARGLTALSECVYLLQVSKK